MRYVSPDSISPDGAGGANSATLRFAGPSRRARLLVYRTDLRRPRLVATRAIPRDESTAALERSCDRRASRCGGVVSAGRASAGCGRERRAAEDPAAPRRGARPSRPGGPVRRRLCGQRRSSSRDAGPRSRSGRTAAGTGGASGASARGGSSTAARADRPRSRWRCGWRRSGVAMLTVRVGHASSHEAVRRSGPAAREGARRAAGRHLAGTQPSGDERRRLPGPAAGGLRG